jgi:hypothetical protein
MWGDDCTKIRKFAWWLEAREHERGLPTVWLWCSAGEVTRVVAGRKHKIWKGKERGAGEAPIVAPYPWRLSQLGTNNMMLYYIQLKIHGQPNLNFYDTRIESVEY